MGEDLKRSTDTPLTVTIIGGAGDGKPIPSGTLATTPDHLQNIVVNSVSVTMALFVRFVSFFLTTFVGLLPLPLTPVGKTMLASAGIDAFLPVVVTVASAALVPTLVDFVKNLVTIFGRLEKTYPLLTGSV